MRSIAVSVYLPTFLFTLGEGALVPLIPSIATGLGSSLAVAGVIAGMLTVGQLIGDIPSGWLVSRIGERVAMIGGAAVATLSAVIALLAPNPLVFAIAILLLGLATAVFALARHAFMTTFVPLHYRARALSTLGGVFRAGLFIGSLAAAPLVHLTGSVFAIYVFMIVFWGATTLVLVFMPNPEEQFGAAKAVRTAGGVPVTTEGIKLAQEESRGLFRTIWHYKGALVRLGTGVGLISAMRASRTVLLPLWAVSIGLDEASTALIIGLSGALDFILFYPSGQVMDRFGRMWSAIPPMIGMGAGMVLLAFTHDVDTRLVWFIVGALVLGVGNGFSAGILMTIGADLAPRRSPAPFLGAWRFTTDAFAAGTPIVIAGLTAAVSLSFAAGAMGVVALAGALLLGRNIPRYLPPEIARGGRRRPDPDEPEPTTDR